MTNPHKDFAQSVLLVSINNKTLTIRSSSDLNYSKFTYQLGNIDLLNCENKMICFNIICIYIFDRTC